MVFFMKTTAPAIDEPNITAQEPVRIEFNQKIIESTNHYLKEG